MTGVLILAPAPIADGLIDAATHIFGARPPRLAALYCDDDRVSPEQLTDQIESALREVDDGHGVLILADIYGSSHTNTACRFVDRTHVELVAGVNLPMLVRVLNHRDLALPDLVDKALSGGNDGIVCAGRRQRPGGAA